MQRLSVGKSLKFLATCAALTLPCASLVFGESGTSAYSFLNIPNGARATALGQAFTSVPNDVQGLVYNPASLASLAASQASFQHLNYVSDVTQEAISYGHAGRDEQYSWGLQANYLRVGEIERTVATGLQSGDGFTKTGDFSTYDMMLGLSGANQFFEGFSAGATAKVIRESLSDASANAAALDAGVLYQSTNERAWNFGASILNAGFSSKFADASVPLPLTLRAGLSGQPFAQWLFAIDMIKRNDTKGEADIGIEVTPKRFISLRAGYRYMLTRPDYGGLADFTAGFGIRLKTVSFDYAFAPLGDLGMTHRVSINMRFLAHRD